MFVFNGNEIRFSAEALRPKLCSQCIFGLNYAVNLIWCEGCFNLKGGWNV